MLVLHNCAVTVSSTGAGNQFQADDNGHVGRSCEVSLAPPYPEPFASYGASAVTQARTSGRGHVAEAKTNVIEVSEFSIMLARAISPTAKRQNFGFIDPNRGHPLLMIAENVFQTGTLEQ